MFVYGRESVAITVFKRSFKKKYSLVNCFFFGKTVFCIRELLVDSVRVVTLELC